MVGMRQIRRLICVWMPGRTSDDTAGPGARVHDGTPRSCSAKVRRWCKGYGQPGFFSDKAAMRMVQGKAVPSKPETGARRMHTACSGGGTTDGSRMRATSTHRRCSELALHYGIDPLTGELVGL